jgi:uncharacterized iron-regulated protein
MRKVKEKMRRALVTLCLALFPAWTGGCAGTSDTVRGWGLSPYPLERELRADDIYHLSTGLLLSRAGFMDMIASADLVYVGETHTNAQAHRVQLEIIRELHDRFPGRLAIGMEMFRTPQQESLDRWTRGELTELEFLKESRWYKNWSSDFGYYREILDFARDNHIDVVALNPSRELQKQLAMAAAGGEKLDPELAAQIPETGAIDPFQEQSLRAVFGGHGGGPKMFDSFFRVQLLWEETMASRIADYLESEAGEGKKMVVLAGTMHVQHGYGVPKKVLRRRPVSYFIVLPSAISIPEEKREELMMDVDMPEIPVPAGDFAWMIPYEDIENERVRMGIMMTAGEEGVFVKMTLEGSPAEAAGIMEGDRLVSVDGLAVEDMSDVILVVNSKNPGDDITVVLLREGKEIVVTPHFPEDTGTGEE